MSSGLVFVLAIAAVLPLLLALFPALHVPGPLAEIVAGVLVGPSALGWVRPDGTIAAFAVFGLSFLLFLAGFEVDVRRFRGEIGRKVIATLSVSLVLAGAVAAAFAVVGMHGVALVAIALLATSLGLVVPVLSDAGALHRPVGVFTVATASAGEVAAVTALSVGNAGSETPLGTKILLFGLLVASLAVVASAVVGAAHVHRLGALVRRLADTSAQLRVRLTVLLVAGVAVLAETLGFEAILGAFLAGVLLRTIDPDPELTHPRYPVKLEAIGFGFLIPVFFVTSGMTLDLTGLLADPSAFTGVPMFVAALLVVRGAPALIFRRELTRREVAASALLTATSLPFLLTVSAIGVEMALIPPATAAALVCAGVVSVLVFPAVAVRLLLPRKGSQTSSFVEETPTRG